MKKSLIEEYFDYQLEYENRYGPKTLILMQVGSFFEFYGVDNEKEKIGNARVIADLLNIQLSRRDKSVLENSRKNAQMGGVPIGNIRKYLNVLIANHYTVVMIEQVTAPPDPKREITHIYSPATYIEECNTPDSNIVVSVFLSESGTAGSPHYSCGMSAIDITTGIPYVYHISSSAMTEDKMAILEDIYRFVENFNPKEVVFTSAGLRTITEKMIGDVLNNSPYRIYHNHYNLLKEDSQHMKVPYLNAILEKIYPNHGILSGIEYVHLERYTDTVTALVLGIQWLYDHDHGIIERLKIPQLYEYHKHLILYHNAAYQLNLVPLGSSSGSASSSASSKYRSLYDIINKTSTAMGRRLLKHHLLNPVTDREILEERYQKVEWMAAYYKDLEKQLNMIGDIERLHRKMALRMLNPQDFSTLYYTYNAIKQILMIIPDEHLATYQVTQEREIATFQEYISYIDAHVDVNEMGKYNLSDIKNSFFKPGTYAEIDAIQAQISATEKYMLDECAAMSAAIRKVDGTAMSGTGSGGSDVVKLEENDRDGYYMTTTARRFDLLPRAVKEAGNWTATKGVGSGVRISNDLFRERSNQLVANRLKIATTVREKYIEFKEILTTKYGEMMDKIIRFIAEIDVVKSHRRCANEYGYHRPVVQDRDGGDSYVAAKGIRHPIIEVIEDKKAYVTNDVYLGKDCRGFLLYGVNGVGKSSLSKAVGINIIMAQMGMYVPSKEFHYYPFTKLFTRINGDDNIFKGMSSFVVEMNELRSILKYSDNRSIVLGDEVCKGTEETSALSIVASTIMRFSERNINFILATHFHKLADLLDCPEKGRKFTNIAFKHLSITIDPAQNAIVYGRKLMDGIGSTNYGVDIARFILDDMEFMKNAKTIRDEILEIDAAIVAPTPSNYHKEIFMDCCAICGKTGEGTQLDTHHIVEQHEFDEHKVHPELDIRRDSGHNLVVLCKNHHDAVHHGNLMIRGYKDTTKGRVLDYEFMESSPQSSHIVPSVMDDNQTAISTLTVGSSSPSSTTSSKKSQKKYTEEIVSLVISEGEKYKDQLNQIKIVQSIMNLEHKMVIPTQTIKKMIAGTY